jgi:hypothetical protein
LKIICPTLPRELAVQRRELHPHRVLVRRPRMFVIAGNRHAARTSVMLFIAPPQTRCRPALAPTTGCLPARCFPTGSPAAMQHRYCSDVGRLDDLRPLVDFDEQERGEFFGRPRH